MADSVSGTNIEFHPLLQKLQDNPVEVETLHGYAGPSDRKGHVRLYASLTDLTQSVEIEAKNILHAEPAPAHFLPYGAITVWVPKDSEVVQRVDQTRSSSDGRQVLRAGRLEIRLPDQPTQGPPPPLCEPLCEAHTALCEEPLCQNS